MFQPTESIFQTIFETLPTAAVLTDTDGKIIKCNQAVLNLYEKDTSYASSDNKCEGLTCLTGHPRYLELVKKILQKGVLKNIELDMVSAKGNEFTATVSAELVKKEDTPKGIIFAIKDITDLKKKEEALKHRFKLEKIVASISTQLIVESDLNKVINNSLAKIGNLNHANRGYIFLINEESKTISNTHEWCKDGLNPQIELLQNLPLSDFPWWIKTLQKGEIIHIKDTSKMPKKAGTEKQLLIKQDIKSLLILPLFLSKKLEGFVAFDNVEEDEKWTDENIALLKIYGDIIGKAIGNKNATDSLVKSEKRFSDISYSTGDWIWEIDINGYYTYSNIAVEEVIGYRIEEVIGRPFYEFYSPEEQEKLKKEGFEKFWAKKEIKGYVTKRRHKNGSTVFLETSATPIFGPNGFEGFRGTNHDITESKNIENILRQEHHKLETVTENVGVGFAIIDRNYRVVWQNKYLKKIAGEFEGQLCYKSKFNCEGNACENCGVKKIFTEGINFDSHVFQKTFAKGKKRWIEIIATPVFDESGNIVSAIEMAVDITEKKELEKQLADYSVGLEKLVKDRTKQLKEAQAKLVKSERLAAIGELAGMVGHDIRNPLTSIKNAAYYLESKGDAITDEKRNTMLSIINKSINQANKIVNDLLDYSREIILELVETTPKAILQNALENMLIPDRIQIRDCTKKEQITVDSAKLERVFVNLINNAIDAIPEKGTITITSKIYNQTMIISFKDSGNGISKENVQKMFTPLFTTKAKGMGLGLAICKRIIEAHNGKITVKSKQGYGTTFTLRLPLKPKKSFGDENIWVLPPEFVLTKTKT
jgi:PAS domain S-box-containing protein